MRFAELVKGEKIVEVINFDTTDPEFKGEMKMVVTLDESRGYSGYH